MASFSQKGLPHPSFLTVSGLSRILSSSNKQVSSPHMRGGRDGAFAYFSQGLKLWPLWLFTAHMLSSHWQKGAAHLLTSCPGKLDCHSVTSDLQWNACGPQRELLKEPSLTCSLQAPCVTLNPALIFFSSHWAHIFPSSGYENSTMTPFQLASQPCTCFQSFFFYCSSCWLGKVLWQAGHFLPHEGIASL